MFNRFRFLAAAVTAVIMLSSCYQVFRSSVFAGIPVDMSTMSSDQKVAYAEDLLASGSEDELEAAYTAIEELIAAQGGAESNPDLALLASELAIGASGLGETMTSALEAVTAGEDISATLLDGLTTGDNLTDLENAVAMMEAAETGGAVPSNEQYANAAAAQMLLVVEDAGGIDNLGSVDPNDPDLLQAQDWADAAGIDIEALLAGGGLR